MAQGLANYAPGEDRFGGEQAGKYQPREQIIKRVTKRTRTQRESKGKPKYRTII